MLDKEQGIKRRRITNSDIVSMAGEGAGKLLNAGLLSIIKGTIVVEKIAGGITSDLEDVSRRSNTRPFGRAVSEVFPATKKRSMRGVRRSIVADARRQIQKIKEATKVSEPQPQP